MSEEKDIMSVKGPEGEKIVIGYSMQIQKDLLEVNHEISYQLRTTKKVLYAILAGGILAGIFGLYIFFKIQEYHLLTHLLK